MAADAAGLCADRPHEQQRPLLGLLAADDVRAGTQSRERLLLAIVQRTSADAGSMRDAREHNRLFVSGDANQFQRADRPGRRRPSARGTRGLFIGAVSYT